MHSQRRHRTLWTRVLSSSCFGYKLSRSAYALIDDNQEDLLLEEKTYLVDSITQSYRSFPPSNPSIIIQSPNLPASSPVFSLSSSPNSSCPSPLAKSTRHRTPLECPGCQRKALRSSSYTGLEHKCRNSVYSKTDPEFSGISNTTSTLSPNPTYQVPTSHSPQTRTLHRRALLSPSNYHNDDLPPSSQRFPKPSQTPGSSSIDPVNEMSLSDGVSILGAASTLVGTGYAAGTYYQERNALRKLDAQRADLEMGVRADTTTVGASIVGTHTGSGAESNSSVGAGAGIAAPSAGVGAERDVSREPVRGYDYMWTGMK